MTYSEAKKYIENIEKKGSNYNLDNIRNLMHEFNDIQDKLKIVHIAGTNGKGSTSSYISSILKSAGYKVGRFSSPAVFEYLEIITIDDITISETQYSDIMKDIIEAVNNLTASGKNEPTAFEIETALAFLYFYKNNCDIVVLETGMGGSFDATNIISSPICSVITSISMDHMEYLGNTLSEITNNKAGIIKANCPVITLKQPSEVLKTIKEKADLQKAKLIIAREPLNISYSMEGSSFDYISESKIYIKDIYTKMLGTFQVENIAVGIETILYLKETGLFLFEENIKQGIKNAKWHGRFEKIFNQPAIFFDGGHNPGAALRIKETIEMYFTNSKIIYIMGILTDKNYKRVLELTAPLADEIITITPNNARGLCGKILAKVAKEYNSNVYYEANLESAFDKAIKRSEKDGIILVFGSLSFLSEAKKGMLNHVNWKKNI